MKPTAPSSRQGRILWIRALLAFAALPAVVAGLVPWLLSRGSPHFIEPSPYGFVSIALGTTILIVSVVSFYRRGRGTLAPWDPPRHLVVRDLYRFNRNPMYVGVVLTVIGWAMISGNLANWIYALVLPLAFHLRVVLYEEREMARLFGDEWEGYRREVPRWGVRLQTRGSRHDG